MPFYFQRLPRCPFCNPFVLMVFHPMGGGGTPLGSAGRLPPSVPNQFPLRSPMRYSLPNKSASRITRPLNISANVSKPSATHAAVGKAALLPFVFVMFAYATGGPVGLEAMGTTGRRALTLLRHLFVPLFWVIPGSLVAS